MKTKQPEAKGTVHSVLESNTEGYDDNDELGIYSMYAVGTDNPTGQQTLYCRNDHKWFIVCNGSGHCS